MLILCVVTVIVALFIYVWIHKLCDNGDNLDKLRDNLWNRKAKWLKSPFDIGLKKPVGKWVYHPSKKIGIMIYMWTFFCCVVLCCVDTKKKNIF